MGHFLFYEVSPKGALPGCCSSKEEVLNLKKVPAEYLDLKEVFCKSRATCLPPHRPYDCAIELKPGTAPPSGRLFSLSRPEEVCGDAAGVAPQEGEGATAGDDAREVCGDAAAVAPWVGGRHVASVAPRADDALEGVMEAAGVAPLEDDAQEGGRGAAGVVPLEDVRDAAAADAQEGGTEAARLSPLRRTTEALQVATLRRTMRDWCPRSWPRWPWDSWPKS